VEQSQARNLTIVLSSGQATSRIFLRAVSPGDDNARVQRFESWAVAILLLCLACGKESAPPSGDAAASASSSATPSTDKKKLAQEIVQWIDEGKHEKVRDLFDPAMERALPNDAAVAQMWSSVEAQFGNLKKQIVAEQTEQKPYTIVLVTSEFEKSPMDVRIVFDEEGRLSGVQVVATQNPAAFGERPQTPKPPFPYAEREVLYDNPVAKTKIGGTLTLPVGAGPHPVVLLITGSGSQDRDETLFGHKPFLVIADHLARKGIAVLRVDDRGVGKSTGDPMVSTIEDHATDVEAGIAFLKTQKEIDPKRIGLAGHSEGGLIAPIVAARSTDVAFIVSLAGPGVSGAELNPMQVKALLEAQKVSPAVIAEIVAGQSKLMQLIVKDAPDAELKAALKELAKAGAKVTPGESPEDAEKSVGVELGRLLSPWFRSWAKLEPAAHLSKVRVPMLILIGDKDLQVPADANIARAKDALAKGGNTQVRAEKLPGLNHLFQTAKTGAVEEYVTISETFNPAALELMTGWLRATAHLE
jgi:pimeloyl-ACP methyl ester carboxylesterase